MTHHYMSEQEVTAAEQRCQQATPGEYEYTLFTHHSGRAIETVADVAETVAYSASRGSRCELYGVSLTEKDDEGRHIVVAYTGNGPNAHNNADFLSAAHQDLPRALADVRELRRVVREMAEAATQRIACTAIKESGECVQCTKRWDAALALAQQVEGASSDEP